MPLAPISNDQWSALVVAADDPEWIGKRWIATRNLDLDGWEVDPDA